MKPIEELRLNSEGLLYTMEKALQAHGSLLAQSTIDEAQTAMASLRRVLETNDIEELSAALGRLEQLAYQRPA